MEIKQRNAAKKARENYQNLSEEEKNKKCQNARNPYRKLFIEKKLNEEEKQNNVGMFSIDIKIFLKTCKTKRVNMDVNDTEMFLKKKTKSAYARER